MVFILLIMFLNISSSFGDSCVINLDILPVFRSGTRNVLLSSWFSSMMPDHGNKCRILRPTTTSISITVNNRWRCSKRPLQKKISTGSWDKRKLTWRGCVTSRAKKQLASIPTGCSKLSILTSALRAEPLKHKPTTRQHDVDMRGAGNKYRGRFEAHPCLSAVI